MEQARNYRKWGWLLIVVGLSMGLLIYLFPENLRAPAWVAYLATSVFVFTGLNLLSTAFGYRRAAATFIILIPFAFTVIAGWISWGPGYRDCTASALFFTTGASNLACRVGFGIGAVFCGLITIAMLWRALHKKPRDGRDSR